MGNLPKTGKKSRLPRLPPLSPDEIERRRLDAIARQETEILASFISEKKREAQEKQVALAHERRRRAAALAGQEAATNDVKRKRVKRPAKISIRLPPHFSPDEAIVGEVLSVIGANGKTEPYVVKTKVVKKLRCSPTLVYDHINWLVLQGRVARDGRNVLALIEGPATQE